MFEEPLKPFLNTVIKITIMQGTQTHLEFLSIVRLFPLLTAITLLLTLQQIHTAAVTKVGFRLIFFSSHFSKIIFLLPTLEDSILLK